jgi:hypothetical protein
MKTMSNARRGLPLTSSRIEKIFPKLTPTQISRITAHGHVRSVQSGELYKKPPKVSPKILAKPSKWPRAEVILITVTFMSIKDA